MSARLFLAHCGYYDRNVLQGIFESHVDLFVVARNFSSAKAKVKKHPEFKRLKMHIDGLLAVDAVDGFRCTMTKDVKLKGTTVTPRAPGAWSSLNKS